MKEEKIEVLLIRPLECPQTVVIDNSLEEMQALVGGLIEEYMPYEDEVALVCNEEGKLLGMELNRAIYTDNGELADIIAGPFFICYAPIESENFLSITPELKEKYEKMFKNPEMFFRNIDGGIEIRKLGRMEREYER